MSQGPQVMNYETSSTGVFGTYPISPWASTRIRMTRYPSPFLDYSSMELPKTAEEILYWCAFFAITNPLVRAALTRKSKHPITELVLRHDSPEFQKSWTRVFTKSLKFRPFMKKCMMAKNVYGRSGFSVFPSFRKFLFCESCGKHFLYEAVDSRVNVRERKWYLQCPHCQSEEPARPVDLNISTPYGQGVTIRQWGPMELQRERKVFSGYDYFVTLPTWAANKIRLGDKKAIANTPQELVDAVMAERRFRLYPDRVFVLEETESVETPVPSKDGFPFGLLAGVLKDAYALTVAKKYEEVAMFTEMLQFRGLAPVATGDPATDVFLSGGLDKWRNLAKEEYLNFLQDPGYIPVFPVPMSYVSMPPGLGPLLPADQIRLRISQICSGIHVPEGLIFEGSTYSGSNMALRLFENDAKQDQAAYIEAAEFVCGELERILGIPVPSEISARPFITADSIQNVGAYSQMVGSGQVPRAVLHEEILGHDHEEMERQLDAENEEMVNRQIRNNRRMQEANFRLQQELPQPPPQAMPPQPGMPGQEQPMEQQFNEFGEPMGPPQDPGMLQPGMAGAQAPGPMPTTGLPSLQQVGAVPPAPTGLPSLQQVGAPNPPAGSSSPQLDTLIAQISPEGVNPQLLFQVTQALREKAPLERAMYLRQVSDRNRRFYDAVLREFTPLSDSAAKPLPEQLPPRRLSQIV